MISSLTLSSNLAVLGGASAVKEPIPAYNSIGQEEKKAVIDFFDAELPLSGFYGSPQPRFYGGEKVREFEAAWSDKFNVPYAVSMNSATSGLIAAMGAVGIGPGDEVIVPPYTMSATAVAPLFYGAVPVFVDIEDTYFCLDTEKVKAAISKDTKAIVAVNLWGHPSRLAELKALADSHGIYLIEDNAQALMAQENAQWTGCIGHIGVFSMNIHKHIQTGEGGVCVCHSKELAERLSLIRNHGENVVNWLEVSDITNLIGFNFRQTEIGAVIGLSQLRKVDEMVDRCRKVAVALSDGIKGLDGLVVPAVREGCSHSYFMWSLRFDTEVVGCSREGFVNALKAEGVPVAQGYVAPLYRLPVFQQKIAIGSNGYPFNLSSVKYFDGMCPVTERLHAREIIQYQPVSWNPSDAQIDQMVHAFHKVHKNASKIDQGLQQ